MRQRGASTGEGLGLAPDGTTGSVSGHSGGSTTKPSPADVSSGASEFYLRALGADEPSGDRLEPRLRSQRSPSGIGAGMSSGTTWLLALGAGVSLLLGGAP